MAEGVKFPLYIFFIAGQVNTSVLEVVDLWKKGKSSSTQSVTFMAKVALLSLLLPCFQVQLWIGRLNSLFIDLYCVCVCVWDVGVLKPQNHRSRAGSSLLGQNVLCPTFYCNQPYYIASSKPNGWHKFTMYTAFWPFTVAQPYLLWKWWNRRLLQ